MMAFVDCLVISYSRLFPVHPWIGRGCSEIASVARKQEQRRKMLAAKYIAGRIQDAFVR